jgi:hypothetical protein
VPGLRPPRRRARCDRHAILRGDARALDGSRLRLPALTDRIRLTGASGTAAVLFPDIADIAARLVISRKTADHHVSAILGKLGARSRGETVAAARRLGLEQ